MKNKTIGYDFSVLSNKKSDNWEEIKSGFTQAHGCKHCNNRWAVQLEWNQPAVNSVIMHDYCSNCMTDDGWIEMTAEG